MENAYWVSPRGFVHEVPITHIDYIIKHPKPFGASLDQIKDLHDKHGEKLGQEGKAREEIMLKYMKRGGIRLRYVTRSGTWTAETWAWTKRAKEALGDWSYKVTNKGNIGYALRMLSVKDRKLINSSTAEVMSGNESYEEFSKEITILDIFKARGNPDKLTEMSLGRVGQHTQKNNLDSYGILTSWRAGNTRAENMKGLKQLEAILKSKGLGFFKMEGHWQEAPDGGQSYEDTPKDQLSDVKEPSLFVPGITYDLIRKLGKKYSQDAIVYSGPEVGNKTVLVFGDGSKQDIGKFHPQKIAQAYSKVHGATFTFEYVTQSWTEKLVEQNYIKMNKGN